MNKLIVTPMREELDCLVQGCTKAGFHAERATVGRLPVVRLPDLGVTLARGGLGKVQFAVQAQHLLDTCSDWDLIICAGAAGALADIVSVGDVVVATTTVEHDYNNKFSKRALPKFDGARANSGSQIRITIGQGVQRSLRSHSEWRRRCGRN